MSLRYLASTNQTQVGASITTSISDAPSSPEPSKLVGGRTLCQTLTTALMSDGGDKSGKARCHNDGSQTAGVICRRERNTFQVTASSLFTLFMCLILLARMSAKTGSWRSIIRLLLKLSAMNTPLAEYWPGCVISIYLALKTARPFAPRQRSSDFKSSRPTA